MNRRTSKRIAAYRDGALSDSERSAVEAQLQSDPEAARELKQTEALGAAVRDAWSDGPASPSPEYLIASLRPELDRVDRQLEASRPWSQLWDSMREAVQAVPGFALAGACALAVLYFIPSAPGNPDRISAASTMNEFAVETPVFPVYDLAGEHPILLLEGQDGSPVIWILENPDEISRWLFRSRGLS